MRIAILPERCAANPGGHLLARICSLRSNGELEVAVRRFVEDPLHTPSPLHETLSREQAYVKT